MVIAVRLAHDSIANFDPSARMNCSFVVGLVSNTGVEVSADPPEMLTIDPLL